MDALNLQIKPHPTDSIFRKHNIPRAVIAEALNLSYTYTSNLLTGIRKPTSAINSRLHALAAQLDRKEGKNVR